MWKVWTFAKDGTGLKQRILYKIADNTAPYSVTSSKWTYNFIESIYEFYQRKWLPIEAASWNTGLHIDYASWIELLSKNDWNNFRKQDDWHKNLYINFRTLNKTAYWIWDNTAWKYYPQKTKIRYVRWSDFNSYDKTNWLIIYPIKDNWWNIQWYFMFPCWNLLLPWDSLPNTPQQIWVCWNNIIELWEQCDWTAWWYPKTQESISPNWSKIITTTSCTDSCQLNETTTRVNIQTWQPENLTWIIYANVLICKNNWTKKQINAGWWTNDNFIQSSSFCWDWAIDTKIWEECEAINNNWTWEYYKLDWSWNVVQMTGWDICWIPWSENACKIILSWDNNCWNWVIDTWEQCDWATFPTWFNTKINISSDWLVYQQANCTNQCLISWKTINNRMINNVCNSWEQYQDSNNICYVCNAWWTWYKISSTPCSNVCWNWIKETANNEECDWSDWITDPTTQSCTTDCKIQNIPSTSSSTCWNWLVEIWSWEQCDYWSYITNQQIYKNNNCTKDCKFENKCWDWIVDETEQCDNWTNNLTYLQKYNDYMWITPLLPWIYCSNQCKFYIVWKSCKAMWISKQICSDNIRLTTDSKKAKFHYVWNFVKFTWYVQYFFNKNAIKKID